MLTRGMRVNGGSDVSILDVVIEKNDSYRAGASPQKPLK